MSAYNRLYHSGGGTVVKSAISYVHNKECLQINPVFLPVKLVYFFFNGAAVSLMPYMAIFMIDQGLSTFQAGIVRGVEPLIHVLVGPIWGSISDRYSRHKMLMIMAIVMPAMFYFSTQYVPPVKVTSSWIPLNESVTSVATEHSVDARVTRIEVDSQLNYHYPVDMYLRDNATNNSLIQLTPIAAQHVAEFFRRNTHTTVAPTKKIDSILTFLLMIFLISGGRFFMSPFNPILDSTVVRMTKEHNSDYGKQRMFASFGFGVFSIISGAAIDAFGRNYPCLNKYTPAFYMYLGLLTLTLLIVSQMQFPPHCRPQTIYRDLCALFLKLEFVMFLLAAFTSGFSLGAINTFLFIFIAELNGPHILMGLNLTATCIAESICLYFSKQMLSKLGHKNIFNLVIFCYAMRHLLYSFVQNPWLVVPIGLLHGICFGAFWPTCTSYVNIVSPVGMEASVQSIAHSTYFGLGRGLGMIIGGIIYTMYGSRNMFRFFAAFSCLILFLLGIAQSYSSWTRRRQLSLSVQYDEI